MSHVDWGTARTTSKRFAGEYPLSDTYHARRFQLQAPDLVARASQLVAESTGLEIPGQPEVGVISRHDWVVTNTQSFARMLQPIEDAAAEANMSELAGTDPEDAAERERPSLAGKAMGVQIGAVLGFMSKRVLGQYELVLPTGDNDFGDSVLFVGANIMSMERQHQVQTFEFPVLGCTARVRPPSPVHRRAMDAPVLLISRRETDLNRRTRKGTSSEDFGRVSVSEGGRSRPNRGQGDRRLARLSRPARSSRQSPGPDVTS